MKEIGEKIKMHRKQIGMSADELAEILGKKGKNRSQYIYDLEKGRVRRIDLGTIKKIANCFKVDPGEFIENGLDENINNDHAIIDIKNLEVDYKDKYLKLLEEHRKLQEKLIGMLEVSKK